MISVCMAVYNGERFIERQLKSILCQLGEHDEVVVSDDGSSDSTLTIIHGFNDKRVRVIDGAHRKSPIWNFEKALLNAKGDFIFLSDQDDEWLPDKVEISMKYLTKYDAIISDNITVDGNGEIINESFFELNRLRHGKYYNLFVHNNYLGCCMAFRRNVLEASLPFPNNIPMHDIWIGNVAAFKFSLTFIPDRLIYYCRHGNNSSSTATPSRSNLLEKLQYRWSIVFGLLKMLLR